MRIYLIRHGQTDWNIQGKIQGSHDIPLNEAGRSQAEQLAGSMDARPVSRIFSSTLIRAMETALRISRRQGVDICPMQQLMEVEFGKWEGLTWAEIRETYPEEYERWYSNPAEFTPPGGEARNDVIKRCMWAVKEMIKMSNGGREDIAVVTHGALMACLVSCMMQGKPEAENIIVENASITTIHYNPLTEDFTQLEINNTAHLRD